MVMIVKATMALLERSAELASSFCWIVRRRNSCDEEEKNKHLSLLSYILYKEEHRMSLTASSTRFDSAKICCMCTCLISTEMTAF